MAGRYIIDGRQRRRWWTVMFVTAARNGNYREAHMDPLFSEVDVTCLANGEDEFL